MTTIRSKTFKYRHVSVDGQTELGAVTLPPIVQLEATLSARELCTQYSLREAVGSVLLHVMPGTGGAKVEARGRHQAVTHRDVASRRSPPLHATDVGRVIVQQAGVGSHLADVSGGDVARDGVAGDEGNE